MATIRRAHGIILQSALDLSFPQALERVLTAAKTLTNSRYAQIFFIEKAEVQPGGLSSSANLRLKLKGKGGQDKEFPCEGIAGVCAQDNTPIICNRPHHDARFNPDIDWAPGSGVKTVACCPMTTVHSKVVGVIQVSNKVIGGYSEEDLHFLDLLGKQAAVTFDLSVKNEQRIAHQRKATALIKGFVKLAGTASPAQLAHKAGLLCKEVCGSIQANCFLAEEGKNDFVSWMKLLDDKADVYKEQQVGFKGFLSEVFLDANRTQIMKPMGGDSGDNNVRVHLGSMYCPISTNGKAIGIVKARGNRKGQFSEVDERMLSALSSMVGVLHENMSRNRIISDSDSGRPWGSIEEAVTSIKQTVKQAANVHTVGVLFYEANTHCFWTLTPPNLKKDPTSSKYLRVSATDFPMGYVLEKKCALHFPAKGSSLSEREVIEMRLLARKFLPPQFDLESLLLVPMFSQGDLVSVLLLLNKHNMSGPFDSYVEKTAQHFAAQWGARLASTLFEERTRAEIHKLKVTFQALPAMVMSPGLEDVLCRLGVYVADLLGAEVCWVMMADKRGVFQVVLHEGVEPVRVDAVDAGLSGEAARRKETIVVEDAEADDRHCEWLGTKANLRIRSVMCAPIFMGEAGDDDGEREVLGVIQVMNKVGEVAQFSDTDADQLEQLCPLASNLIENTRSLGELETLQEDVKISFERRNLIVSETASLHEVGSTRGLLSRSRRLARSLLGARDCTIFLVGYDRDKMFELRDDLREQSYYEEQLGIVGYVIKNGKAVLYDADNTDPSIADLFHKDVDQRGATTAVSSLLCVPLRDEEGTVIGAWHLCNCVDRRAFRDEDAELLLTLGRHLVEALRNEGSLSKMLECNRRLRDCVALADPAERLHQISQGLKRVIVAERVNVFVRSGQAMVASDELTGQDIVIPIGQGYVGRCGNSENRSAVIMGNINKDSLFRPSVDGRSDIQIQHALYVPVLNHSGQTMLVIEVLNKISAPFDPSDVLVTEIMGANALDAVESQSEHVHLEEARRQALQLLTSVQYLYPVNSDADSILNSAVTQMAHVLKAKARIYLGIPTEGGISEDQWTCYDSEGSALSGPVGIGGVAGSCFKKVAPIMISSEDVEEGEESGDLHATATSPGAARSPGRGSYPSSPSLGRHSPLGAGQGGGSPVTMVPAGDGRENTSTILCQPLMDAVSQRPIGVLEFRRVQRELEAVKSFSVLDQELAYHLSVLLVHAMVNHSKRIRGEGGGSRRMSGESAGRMSPT